MEACIGLKSLPERKRKCQEVIHRLVGEGKLDQSLEGHMSKISKEWARYRATAEDLLLVLCGGEIIKDQYSGKIEPLSKLTIEHLGGGGECERLTYGNKAPLPRIYKEVVVQGLNKEKYASYSFNSQIKSEEERGKVFSKFKGSGLVCSVCGEPDFSVLQDGHNVYFWENIIDIKPYLNGQRFVICSSCNHQQERFDPDEWQGRKPIAYNLVERKLVFNAVKDILYPMG